MTEKTLEERVAELEGWADLTEAEVNRLSAFVKDKWEWTSAAGEDQHRHGVPPIPIHGGSRKESPLLGFEAGTGAAPCCNCGEPSSNHPCPEVRV